MGEDLIAFLLDQGFSVRATDLPDADRSALNPRAEFVESDLLRPSTLAKLFDGASRCYHLAEISDPGATFVDHYNANVIGTRNLLRASLPFKESLESIVVRSAAGVYGTFKRGPFREDDFLDPRDDFHKTMAAREELALDFERTAKLPVVVLRLAPVYGGARERPKGPAVHALDAARAAHFVSDRSGSVGDIFHLCDEDCPGALDTAKIRALGFTLTYPHRTPPARSAARSEAPGLGSV